MPASGVLEPGPRDCTVLLTDIEDSTRLWERHPERMETAVRDHNRLIAGVVDDAHGAVLRSTGDGILALFEDAPEAVDAAVKIQRSLLEVTWPGIGRLSVRVGMNSGTCTIHDGELFGRPPNLASRLQSIGHGGQILMSDATASICTGRLLAGEQLVDLGPYQIRGFDEPVVVHSVIADGLPAAFPPLRTAYAGFEELPLDDPVLFGRDGVVDEVVRRLQDDPLVTLWGPGGVGKTRIALRVGTRSGRAFRDGVRLVDLTSVTDPSTVTDTVAAALRGQPVSGERAEDTVLRLLGPSQMLLILDNCEHVLPPVRRLVSVVLQACPTVRLLSTSREPLGLLRERAIEVRSLVVPDRGALSPTALSGYPSVQLFADRLRRSVPEFTLSEENAAAVAAACRAVDGLPLALELVAAQVGIDGVDAPGDQSARLYARLDTAGHESRRNLSVAASVNSSYARLEPGEAELFLRLAVFTGSFSRELALGIAPAGREAERAFDRLVHTALVQREDDVGRSYRLLAPFREFARAQMPAPAWMALCADHALLMLGLAERCAPRLRTHEERAAAEQLGREFPEHRAAMAHFLQQGALEEGARLLVALFQYCLFQPRPEAHEWASALAARTDPGSPHAAEVLGAAALGAWFGGDIDRAISLGTAAIDVAASTGSPARWARTALLDAYGYLGDIEKAAPHFVALVAGLRREPELFWQINGLGHEAISLLMLGRPDVAHERAVRALELARRLGNPDCTQWALSAFGRVLAPTDPAAACDAFEEAMSASREVGSRFNVSLNLVEWVSLKRELGDWTSAVTGALDLIDLLAVSGNRSQLSQALREVAALLAAAGRDVEAAIILLARRGLPSMPRAGRDVPADDRLLDRLQNALASRWSRLSVRAYALNETQLIELCRAELVALQQDSAGRADGAQPSKPDRVR